MTRRTGIRRVKGRPVCTTAYDGRGRAHLRHPLERGKAVCGRDLELAGKPNGKSCFDCAAGAREANALLREFIA